MTDRKIIPAVKVKFEHSAAATQINEMGMREMQARAYQKRGAQYLLIKSPPASGKSRALMFIALDKLHNQGLRKAIICVPERAIGSSFNDTPLSALGFPWDWRIAPQWNLCKTEGSDAGRSKARAVADFLHSDDRILLCTHATFRRAFELCGAAAFDDCLIAIDEFHHLSADIEGNILGRQLSELMARGKAHITAMTGSYFRGDAAPVLNPDDEEKFTPVVYSYYEQLNSYSWLKQLELGYYFYQGSYLDSISEIIDPWEKTIIHIPHVAGRESSGDKVKEVERIMDAIAARAGGQWAGADAETGFQILVCPNGRSLRIADLVDDEPKRRNRVLTALKDPMQARNRDHVDMIIALGMAKEGFDWIWCEHALTVGYRASLTEIVQIIGRCTRDAPGKTEACFTNLIAEPDASAENVAEAINDTLKAIAASLLMEQVLAPKFEFVPKRPAEESRPAYGFDYGGSGYQPAAANAGYNQDTGAIQIEIKGLKQPQSPEAQRICTGDLTDIIVPFLQNRETAGRGLFDRDNTIAEELTQISMAKIIEAKHPELSPDDKEAIRQRAVAQLNIIQQAKQEAGKAAQAAEAAGIGSQIADRSANTALLDGVRRYITDVRNLTVDLIDSINPFNEAYSIVSKAMNAQCLKQMHDIIAARKVKIDAEEAKLLAKRAVDFKRDRGRLPAINAADPWEKRMAEGAAAFIRYKSEGLYEQ